MNPNSNMSISPIRTATLRLTFFFRCGNKENRETLFRKLFERRAVSVIKTGASLKTAALFESFFLSATPFIGLKTRRRRRGKRIIVKLIPLERSRGERSSFIALSNILRVSGAASKPFVNRLERELEILTRQSANTSVDQKVSSGSSTIREKRDESHKLAYSSRPYRWKRRSRKVNHKRKNIYV